MAVGCEDLRRSCVVSRAGTRQERPGAEKVCEGCLLVLRVVLQLARPHGEVLNDVTGYRRRKGTGGRADHLMTGKRQSKAYRSKEDGQEEGRRLGGWSKDLGRQSISKLRRQAGGGKARGG